MQTGLCDAAQSGKQGTHKGTQSLLKEYAAICDGQIADRPKISNARRFSLPNSDCVDVMMTKSSVSHGLEYGDDFDRNRNQDEVKNLLDVDIEEVLNNTAEIQFEMYGSPAVSQVVRQGEIDSEDDDIVESNPLPSNRKSTAKSASSAPCSSKSKPSSSG